MISIITPTFNSANTISKNVASVLSQSYKEFEQIIIDNKSTDDTLLIAKKIYKENNSELKLKIICENDNGISDAFNKGIKAAAGNIIGILNSDDYYYSESVFKKVIDALKVESTLFTHGDIFFEDEIYGSNVRKPLLCPITTAMPYNHPTMFFRKDVYQKYGMFDENFRYAMDYELICRFEKHITGFRNKGTYIAGSPIAVMRAGGVSWENELTGIEEAKKTLIKYGLWSFAAKGKYLLRMFRVKMKGYFHFVGLKIIVKKWRNNKWKN